MGYLVSIEDVTPPARADGNPWTQAAIEESKEMGGPWTVLTTIPISPIDTDPEHPQVRAFSTDLATLTEGFYRLTVSGAVGDSYAMNPLPLFPKVFAPTVADVAVLVRSRTVDSAGNVLGTFTEDTRPTAIEVHGLIALAVGVVSTIATVTFDSPPAAILQARNLAALYAAVTLESSYFQEQINSDQSAYEALLDRFREGIPRLENLMPDSNTTKKGMYSIPTRSDIAGAGLLSAAEQLP